MTEPDLYHPWMPDADRIEVLRVLTSFHVKHLHILEYGAGGSTHYFPRKLRKYRIGCDWTAIEHDPVWFRECNAVRLPGVYIHVVPYSVTSREALRTVPMDAYVNAPATMNRQWHVILIDGRKRRQCLIAAKSLLKPGGVVVLLDAQREYYHCGLEGYVGDFVTPTMWVGRVCPACTIDAQGGIVHAEAHRAIHDALVDKNVDGVDNPPENP